MRGWQLREARYARVTLLRWARSMRRWLLFIAGAPCSSRETIGLAARWAAELERARPRPIVLGGAFEAGSYVPWERDVSSASSARAKLERLLSVSESVVSLGELVLPAAITDLLGHILSKSKAGLDLTSSVIAEAEDPATVSLLPQALRRLCDDGPAVCVIEARDGDAGGLWADLVSLFARRVARDIPLMLILHWTDPSASAGTSTTSPKR